MASIRAQWVRYYAEVEMGGVFGARKVSEWDMNQYFTMCGGPYAAHDHKTSWCGIFAAYVMRNAGVQVHWAMGKGLQLGSNVEVIRGHEGLDEGDVAYAGGQHNIGGVLTNLNHFFIIVRPPGNQGVPWAIHGNYAGAGSDHQLFYGFHPKYTVSTIAQYYRVY